MHFDLKLQPLQVYLSDMTSLKKVLEDVQHMEKFYGLLIGRFGKVEGFFSSSELLHYCLHIGLDYVDDIDHLRSFSKYTNKNYSILSSIPTEHLPVEDHIELFIINKDGQYIGCIDRDSYTRALTKQQQHEIRHYQTIFQAMPNGVIAVDIEGHIIMMNRAGEKISGVPYEKAIGQFITNVVPPKGLLEVLQTGQGQIEKYQVRKRWYISYREPIYDGKKLVGAVGVFDDISKMETLTSDLATYQQLLHENELLLNTSSLGIAVMDTDGNIVRQNKQFQQFYFLIMYDDYERTQFRNAFQNIQQHKKQPEKILYIQTKQQQRLKCRLTPIPSAYNSNSERIIVQLEDITEEYEQQKHMTRFKQHIRLFFSLRHFDAISISKAFEERLQHIAKVNAPVLLIGNIGTGRSITAKQIIKYSDRQMMPFIEINCIGLTKKHLEQLLFSIYDPPPLLTLAAGGTLYIKNIDYLPISLQQRFIPVIKRMNELNIRLITSISQTEDPPPQIDEQLYYLINAITLTHPPLTKRTDHSKEVIQQLLANLCEKHNRTITLPEESIQFLIQHDWPENFHSIANLLEYFCLHVKADIWQPILFQQLEVNITNKPIIVNSIFPLKDAVKTVEKEMLKLLIEKNISYRQMAKILDVNPSTIVRKVKSMEVESIDS